MSLVEEGVLELDDDGSFGPRRRSPADRRRRDGRAPARAPVGHRRLLRRGCRTRDHRLRAAGACARARRRPRTTSRARWVPDGLRARRAVRVLQRRLRRARADRRAGERRAVPRARRAAGVRAGGDGDTAFLRSDELPGDAALGYLDVDGPRTNVFHLPVRGSGDGGIYSTAADLSAFWRALVRRSDRARGTGGRDGAAAQRRAGRVETLRARVLAARDDRMPCC